MATTIGLLHPGEMGSVVGKAARAGGSRVLWVSDGRSPASRNRAAAAGLEDAGTLGEVVAQSDVILSICPPANAIDIARQVAALGFGGTYVDANAVSPATTRSIGDFPRAIYVTDALICLVLVGASRFWERAVVRGLQSFGGRGERKSPRRAPHRGRAMTRSRYALLGRHRGAAIGCGRRRPGLDPATGHKSHHGNDRQAIEHRAEVSPR